MFAEFQNIIWEYKIISVSGIYFDEPGVCFDDSLKVGYNVEVVERWPSGLWRRTRNAVHDFLVTWVQIPPSPPFHRFMIQD
jgi:hypothetical protein